MITMHTDCNLGLLHLHCYLTLLILLQNSFHSPHHQRVPQGLSNQSNVPDLYKYSQMYQTYTNTVKCTRPIQIQSNVPDLYKYSQMYQTYTNTVKCTRPIQIHVHVTQRPLLHVRTSNFHPWNAKNHFWHHSFICILKYHGLSSRSRCHRSRSRYTC